MLRIYICGKISSIDRENYTSGLIQRNHYVFPVKSNDSFNIVRDIAFCNILIIFGTENTTELGVALGLLKDIYVVGKKEDAPFFFNHPSIEWIEDWNSLFKLEL